MAQGRRRRRIVESYDKEWYGARDRDVVIDDGCKGRAQCFCQLNRFVCPFIVHLSRFLPTSSILIRFITIIISFSSHFCFSLLRMFPHAPAFTVQSSNSSNSPSSLSLLRLSQTNISSCHRLMCLLCWTSFRQRRRFSPRPASTKSTSVTSSKLEISN